MKTIIVGSCRDDSIYYQVDPDALSETEFEYTVVQALTCLYPKYKCILFGGSFVYDARRYKPDIALVANDFSHWFVIEVELIAHSLERHVLPQVRAFQYGKPQSDCLSILVRELGIQNSQACTLLNYIPRSVVVITNKDSQEWKKALSVLDIQMISVMRYISSNGHNATEVTGTLTVQKENLGFGQYQAVHRSVRFVGIPSKIPNGRIQIDEPTAPCACWIARSEENILWLTKERGLPDMMEGSYVQLIRTYDGRLAFRLP